MGTQGGRVGCKLLRCQGGGDMSICSSTGRGECECAVASSTSIVYYKWQCLLRCDRLGRVGLQVPAFEYSDDVTRHVPACKVRMQAAANF